MAKKKKTVGSKRKKDAQSEIEILATMFPEVKTKTVSVITGRNLSLASKLLSKLKKEKGYIFDRSIHNHRQFNETNMAASVMVLSNIVPSLRIPYILDVPIDFVYKVLDESYDEYEFNVCPKGHAYVAKKGLVEFCPVCFKHNGEHERAEKRECKEFTGGPDREKNRERFAVLLTEASSIVTLYYKSRERNDILLRYIKSFRDLLIWLKYDCVTVGDFDIPFFAGCQLIEANPYLLREKFYVKILRRERRLERMVKKERMVKLDNIDDLFGFVDFYIRIYESLGGLGRGTTVSYQPLQNSVAFFEAL